MQMGRFPLQTSCHNVTFHPSQSRKIGDGGGGGGGKYLFDKVRAAERTNVGVVEFVVTRMAELEFLCHPCR